MGLKTDHERTLGRASFAHIGIQLPIRASELAYSGDVSAFELPDDLEAIVANTNATWWYSVVFCRGEIVWFSFLREPLFG